MKSDQARVSKLLVDTITLLCKNGLVYNEKITVQGLLGITVDNNEVFLVHVNEQIAGSAGVPSSEQSTKKVSTEPSAKKKTVASCSNVVDLTRVADNPQPVQPSVLSSEAPAGRSGARLKHRLPVPAAVMTSQQQSPPRMKRGLHPRMAATRGTPTGWPPSTVASQFASNYLAQLRQQVARGMSPMSRGMSPMYTMTPPKQRAVNQHTTEVITSQSCTTADDDDEEDDVVIVGTGHEEPSPSWGSPMRKRPLPSRTSHSPASLQKRNRLSSQPNQTSGQKKPAVRNSPAITEQLSSADVAGTLELTADDIPTSIEDMIMNIEPTAVITPKKHSSMAEMPPGDCTASLIPANSALSLGGNEDCVAAAQLTQPDTVAGINAAGVDDALDVATISQQNSGENIRNDATVSLPPFVYTDIASDVVSTCDIYEMQLAFVIKYYF